MTFLLVTKYNNNEGKARLRGISTFDGSVTNFEKNLEKNKGAWEYAFMCKDGQILHYYWHSSHLERLDNKKYIKQLNATRVNLYIVYTYAYKERTGNKKGDTIFDSSIEEMPNYYNADVSKVMAYLDNKLISTYQHGQYL